jgi:DNA processing protein
LVENAQDIIDALAAQNRVAENERDLLGWSDGMNEQETDPVALLSLRRQVLELLSFTPLHRDEILREADAPPGLLADVLLELVLSGEAVEHSGGRFSLRAD